MGMGLGRVGLGFGAWKVYFCEPGFSMHITLAFIILFDPKNISTQILESSRPIMKCENRLIYTSEVLSSQNRLKQKKFIVCVCVCVMVQMYASICVSVYEISVFCFFIQYMLLFARWSNY